MCLALQIPSGSPATRAATFLDSRRKGPDLVTLLEGSFGKRTLNSERTVRLRTVFWLPSTAERRGSPGESGLNRAIDRLGIGDD